MRIKFLSIFAAVSLLAACETAPTETSNVESTGVKTDAVSTSPSNPTTIVPGSSEDFAANVTDRVFFAFDSFSLDEKARRILKNQASWLRKYPATMVTLEGHCDTVGTREYNMALGERRANAVKDYLISLGSDPSHITTTSYGEERPINKGTTKKDQAAGNRRSVTVIN
ncbi:peptidoglycan-associated lipoprotein [Candidatus Endolissoclinum faulkneri L5]|uniref:Peptidoglycan-associated lipoprotein n=1 Tax=Candidatus Endolissoclinum faulkneri L5 TaxID=1401328 RepID=V9TW12_9PROT|nr:OmpA family protein [Candidatus Endolissoclinum faulkneri]AHC73515.1 peptidoglycan-associated lipoprotein [Candidatus Endolissoclinum faulkneri L5]